MSRGASAVMRKEFDKAKLEFPFEGDLFEIQNEAGKWLQTTRVTFRSYDGPRRITTYDTNLTIDPRNIQWFILRVIVNYTKVLSIIMEVIAKVVGEAPLRYYIHRS